MNSDALLQSIRESLQRGERAFAQKQLAGFLIEHPKSDAAWMLMAQAVDNEKQKTDCYERAIKINPKNIKAKQELVRMEFPGYTFHPQRGIVAETAKETAGRFRFFSRALFVFMIVFMALVGATLSYAKNNPESQLAQILPALPSINLEKFNPLQYDSPEDAFIQLAKDAAKTGMDGAPAQPGASITPSISVGSETFAMLVQAVPQAGASSSVTVSEYQATSMAALVLQQNPKIPARNMQVYFRNGQILIWCIVDGNGVSTSALLTGNIQVDANGSLSFKINSAQAGQEKLSGVLLAQAQAMIDQTIISEINAQAHGLKVVSINVNGGVISAVVKR